MRILLVNTNRERSPQPVIPLGLCLVASALAARGFEPHVLDLIFSRRPEADLVRGVGGRKPDVIDLLVRNLDNGDLLRTRQYLPDAVELVRVCRAYSGAPTVIGGSAVNVAAAEVLNHIGADYAIAGDGEEAMPELVSRLSAGTGASDLPCMCSRGSGRPTPAATGATCRVSDLDSLPLAQVGRWLDPRLPCAKP